MLQTFSLLMLLSNSVSLMPQSEKCSPFTVIGIRLIRFKNMLLSNVYKYFSQEAEKGKWKPLLG